VSRRGAALVLLLLPLGGCLLGPDYARPPVALPERWQEPADDQGSLADQGWWQFFDDPVLADLIRVAREQSNDVRVAAARVEQARAELVVAGAARFPQLDGSGSYTNTRLSEVSFPAIITFPGTPPRFQFKPQGQTYRTTLDLSFELDLWGRLRRATEAARAELLASDAARRTVLFTLVSDVATLYFNLLERDEELAISRDTVDTRRETLRILRLRFREGISPELDVRRAEGELAAATNTVPDLERQVRQLENALSLLLGRNPGPIPRGRALTAYTVPLEVPAGLPSVLLERRPDVRQAEQQLVAANARIGQAKAAFFPRITLTGSYGVESRELAMLFTGPAQVWSFGPSISAPIFNAGRVRAGVDFAEAQRDEALAQYRRVVQTAFREVEDALIAHRKNREEVIEDQTQVAAYREVVRLARLRYFNGVGTQFEVLDAERQLLAAQLATARTIGDQLGALVQLYKALGGGWTSERESSPTR
jgi:multidrug efflux system outer membrane protein